MKLVKGFTVIAAGALVCLAVFGSSSASATSLCKAQGNSCTAGNTYPIGTFFEAAIASGTTTIEGGAINDECEESVTVGKTTAAGTPLFGVVNGLNFSLCTCETTTAVHLPYKLEIKATGFGDGTLGASTGGNGSPGLHVICGGVSCTYETSKAVFSFNPGNPALLEANIRMALNTGVSDFLCLFTGEAIWLGEYQFAAPKPLYITS